MSLKEISLNDSSSSIGNSDCGYSPTSNNFNGNNRVDNKVIPRIFMVLEKHDELDDEDHVEHHGDHHPLVSSGNGNGIVGIQSYPPASDLYFNNNNNKTAAATAVKFKSSVKFDDNPMPLPSNIATPLNAAPDGGYGWVIVFVAFFVSVLTDGALYSFGIFMPVYIQDFNSTSATVSWVGSFGAGTTCILGLYAGHYADKYGNNKVLFAGALISSLGYLLASFSTELWHLFLTQGLICGIGFSLSYTSALSVVGQWFTRRRGLALGLSVCGSGLGVFIMVNIIGKLLDSYGWQTTLRYLALIEIVGLSLCAFLVKRLLPLTAEGGPSITETAKEYMKDKHFFYLYMGYVLAVFGLGMGGHLPTYCVLQGLNDSQARFILSMNGVASALGRIMIGYIADHLGKLLVLRICMLSASVISFCLIGFSSFPLIMLYSMVMGFNVGGCFSLLPSIVAELFGVNQLGSLLGLMYTAFAWGNIFAMPMCGWLFLIQGTYEIPIAVCGVFFFIAGVCVDYMCEAASLVHLKAMSVIPHHDISQKVYITENYLQQSQHGSNSGGSVHGGSGDYNDTTINLNDYESGGGISNSSSGFTLSRPRNMSAISAMSGYSSGVGGGMTPSASAAAAKISQRQRMNSNASQTSAAAEGGISGSIAGQTYNIPPSSSSPSTRQPDKNTSLIKAMTSGKAVASVKTAMISIKERARSVSNASMSSATSLSNIQLSSSGLFNSNSGNNNNNNNNNSPMNGNTRSRMNSVSSNPGGLYNLNMPTTPVSSSTHGGGIGNIGLRIPLSMTPTAISNRMKHAYSFTQQHDPDVTDGDGGGDNNSGDDDYTTMINFNNNSSSKKSSNPSNSDKKNSSTADNNNNNNNTTMITDSDITAEMTQTLNNAPSSSSLYNSNSTTTTPRSNKGGGNSNSNNNSIDGSDVMSPNTSSSSCKRNGSIYNNNNNDINSNNNRLPPIRESVSESVQSTTDSHSHPSSTATTNTPSHSAFQSQQSAPPTAAVSTHDHHNHQLSSESSLQSVNLTAAGITPTDSAAVIQQQQPLQSVVTQEGNNSTSDNSDGSTKDANGDAILFYDEHLFDDESSKKS